MIKSLNEMSLAEQRTFFTEILENQKNLVGFNWTVETLLSQLAEAQGAGWIKETQPASFVIWKNIAPEAEILCLMTSTKFRQQGAMESLLTEVFAANSHISSWWLEVHEKNLGALNLYQKMDFKRQGERKRYYSDGGSALILRKTITP